MSLFRPGYVLDKFYPEFDQKQLVSSEIKNMQFEPNKEVHIKVTRQTEYGDRYKLFVIQKSLSLVHQYQKVHTRLLVLL